MSFTLDTDILNRVFEEKDKADAKWNKANKPIKEVTIVEDDEKYVIGLWKGSGNEVFYAQKTKNKKIPYRPQSLIKLDPDVVKAIKEL